MQLAGAIFSESFFGLFLLTIAPLKKNAYICNTFFITNK